jgi:hypothetical protein
MRESVHEVVLDLRALPVRPDVAVRPSSEGGVPAAPGFYAWWITRGVLSGVPDRPHPAAKALSLLYVGISPARATSAHDLRGRLLGNHLRGNTGSSTFRLTLASLLLDEVGWLPVSQGAKAVLTAADNSALSRWQAENLSLSWSTYARPWEIEHPVIEEMKPPLNLAGNASDAFYETVRTARQRFRAAAKDGL